MKLKKPLALKNIRSTFFSHRINNAGSRLPGEVISAIIAAQFKTYLDKA